MNSTLRHCTLRALAAVLLAAMNTACAGQFEDGLTAYDRKDYATALKLFQPLAKQGNVHAQTNLGACTLTATAFRMTMRN